MKLDEASAGIAFHISQQNELRRQQMNIIALIDTRPELPGETIGTVISTHPTIADAFTANDAFQKNSGSTSYIRTKIVTLKVRLGDGACTWHRWVLHKKIIHGSRSVTARETKEHDKLAKPKIHHTRCRGRNLVLNVPK